MWFWIRNIALLLLLGSMAVLLLTRPDFLLSANTANQAADGFSSFYSKIRSYSSSEGELSDYKLRLPDNSNRLTQQLQQRGAIVPPAAENWRGAITDRRFREGDTLKTQLSHYASEEGIELFWILNTDYVVKQYFQTNTTLIETVHHISTAIAHDFPNPVLAFFCPQERAAVITDKPNAYLNQQCIPANTKPGRQTD